MTFSTTFATNRTAGGAVPLAALLTTVLAALLSACAPAPLQQGASTASTAATSTGAAPAGGTSKRAAARKAQTPTLLEPEAGSGWSAKQGFTGQRFAVATANPWASQAGLEMLKAGGSALDAAIAAQWVLTLVEPQSSGIGGGAFLLHADTQQRVEAYDGRETAPQAATERLFFKPNGEVMGFMEATVGGRSVAVPGVVALLYQAHQKHGVLPWARLFEPAIALAREGFPVSARLHTLLAGEQALRKDPEAAAYFYDPEGRPWPVGHVLKNPALARVFERVAAEGPSGFYSGPVAQAIVNKVRSHPSNPGVMALADLERYTVRERLPLCMRHAAPRRAVQICGFPPPSSGMVTVGQILSLMTHAPSREAVLEGTGTPRTPSAAWLHDYAQASRLAYADRARYVADPDFVTPPAGHWSSLLGKDYLRERAQLLTTPVNEPIRAGNPAPWPLMKAQLAPSPEQVEHGTSHISVIDAAGRAVAMTSSIESAFGARQMVEGFLLNNHMTDFSFNPRDALGTPVINRIEPGKRPRSSMSPTLVFDAQSGELLMSLGSPGGSMIIHYVSKVLWGMLHWGLSPQQAIDLPNMAWTGAEQGALMVEHKGTAALPDATRQALRDRGWTVSEQALTSGLQAIERQKGQLRGGADPRREGVVMGE